jgi:uncharacterized damage-inducible protein DinB
MREKDRLVKQLSGAYRGPAWHGPSLAQVLEGVTPLQASSRPLAGAHSIGELVLHVTVWIDESRRRLTEASRELMPAEDWPVFDGKEESWQNALRALESSESRLEAAVAALPEDGLERRIQGAEYNVRFMLHGVINHNLYHAGQIALLKRAFSS